MTLKLIGFKEAQANLIELAGRGADARPVLQRVAAEFRSDQRSNYSRGGRPRWKPLDPEYAAYKASKGRGAQIGVFSGALRASLVNRYDPYNLEVVLKDRLRMGTTLPTANLFNGRHKDRKQPKRKLIALTPSRRREYLQMVQDYIVSGDL